MFPVKQQSPLFHEEFLTSRGDDGDFLVYFPDDVCLQDAYSHGINA